MCEMTFSFARMGAVALGVALLAPQAFAADAKDPVLATVNGTEIHESQIREFAVNIPPQVRAQMGARQIVETVVNIKLMADDARKQHLDNEPEVKKALKVVEDQLLRQAWERKLSTMVTEDQAKKRYDELVPTFKPQEEVHAHHILLETEEQARAVLADLRSGGNFEDLAKQKSKDPSAAQNGGDLGFFAKGMMVPEFADAAFALKPGETSTQPVKTQFGYHIIRADEKRMSSLPAFADVKDDIRRDLGRQAAQEAFKALREKAKVEIKLPEAPAGQPGK